MKKNLSLSNFTRPHFIGVGGISMSALAKACINLGLKVSGSDVSNNDQIISLKKLGAIIYKGHSALNIGSADVVIYSSAISKDNAELKYAVEKQLPVLKRSEFLNLILQNIEKTIAVSGSHGKTTTTAMLSEIFINANLNPTVFLGGENSTFGNYKRGKNKYAIVEACEYKKNFLDIKHQISVVLNVDNDHFDSYDGMQDMLNAFTEFIGKNLAVINADDEYSSRLFNGATVTFGIEKNAVFTAKNIKFNGEGYSFSAYNYSNKLGKIDLKIAGRHNVYNALACVAVSTLCGIDFKVVKESLESFNGVNRRNEKIGIIENVNAVCDYAHHPKEIMATLSAYEKEKENLVVVFQPHTYSRTKILMNDFIEALKSCKNLIIFKTYPAREDYIDEGSAEKLYQNILAENPSVKYADSEEELYAKLQDIKRENSVSKVLFLGAGDIYNIAKNLVNAFKNKDKNAQKIVYKM